VFSVFRAVEVPIEEWANWYSRLPLKQEFFGGSKPSSSAIASLAQLDTAPRFYRDDSESDSREGHNNRV
jgi:hypothetical protein